MRALAPPAGAPASAVPARHVGRRAPAANCVRGSRLSAPTRRAAAAAAAGSASASAGGECGPVGWRGDKLLHSTLPLLPDGAPPAPHARKPDYSSIDRLPQSLVLTAVIRKLLVREVGRDNDARPWTSFDALMTPVREVNDMPGSARDVQVRAKRVFAGILPELGLGWVPGVWKRVVQPSAPAWATNYAFYLVFATLFPWLMGPMEGVDHVDTPARLRALLPFLPATLRLPQSVKAERCRFLETAQCASVCVNSCKVPSQEWLGEDFGLALHIQPNYRDFSCTWAFSKAPPPLAEDEAVLTPCFAACPSEFKGTKDAARQALATLPPRGALEAIAARASPEALADAGARVEALVGGQSKCWSVDAERAAAVSVMRRAEDA